MQDALSAMMMSAKVRRDADSMVIRSQQIQKAAHDAVQQAMNQKLAETENLKVRMQTLFFFYMWVCLYILHRHVK